MSISLSKIDEYEVLFDINGKTIQNDVEDTNNKIIICKDCNIPGTTHGLDMWECPSCGAYLESLIDNSAEWRMYPDGSRPESIRCSTVVNNLLPQSSKGTIILSNSNSNYSMRRTQKVHSWSAMTYKERCLNNIFQDITLRSLNGCILGNVTKLAHEYYKTVSELYIARGVMRKGLIAACLFMACKKQGVPRTCQEIAEIFQISDKWVTRGNKKFTELWSRAGKEHISYKDDCQSMDYLARFCSKLYQDDGELLKKSRDVSSICKSNSILSQNTPVSIAAASIYMATTLLDIDTKVLRSDIAEVAKTSQVTIGKCYKEMLKYPQFFDSQRNKNIM
jgi:transcription initiation factor TFIIB|uniref:Cyclin-like domain-containing protein n=1 Tax=viral metagenome TaxID=1070528 RepID=A0A6C0AGI9_9ZZZZ|tara:strand:- start:4499 stop:5503 length:1005 start_codon:yes stop_codon:yes gene_type:complete